MSAPPLVHGPRVCTVYHEYVDGWAHLAQFLPPHLAKVCPCQGLFNYLTTQPLPIDVYEVTPKTGFLSVKGLLNPTDGLALQRTASSFSGPVDAKSAYVSDREVAYSVAPAMRCS